MKKLSDYKGDEAIELWADLMEPVGAIISNKATADAIGSKKPAVFIIREILKANKAEATQMLLRIDPTPLNGLNIVTRLIGIVQEMMGDETIMGFFNSQGQKSEPKSSGSAMGSIEGEETLDAS